ncbi:unnamed protein product [Microthlaspi erraticum]|uniref:Uncharacterized protein n=1 Tax=Microthlaspi erraticum TaxID=1685480 RepID=A0A6D2KWG4_9BRAS|nr:unnamed protein product [Microthlaspi erraticum]
MEGLKEADKTSYGVIVNTFQELEPAYVKDYKEARSGKAWSIGPVSLCNKLKELGLGLEESKRPFIWVIRGWEKYKELVSGSRRAVSKKESKTEDLSSRMVSSNDYPFTSFCWRVLNALRMELNSRGDNLWSTAAYMAAICRPILQREIGRAGVKKAVEELMGESDDATERRRRAKELGELAHKAVEEGGSSHSNITLLLEDIMQLAQSKN